jgi:glyoxylase-like metal-dependent hydrolase (beta-lactamase superfamily II)
MELYTLDTGYFKLDGGAMFGVVPKMLWEKKNAPDARNLCSWAMRCLLLRWDNRVMVVDTGIGTKQDEKFFSHYDLHGDGTLLNSLAKHGIEPNDVTDVLLTHLHFDHVGGAVERVGERLAPTFANATYWTNKRHWDWATEPNPREKASFLTDNMLPLQQAGQLAYTDGIDMPFGPAVELIYVDGHTEQMMLPLITTSSGARYLFPADLVPSSHHIPLPWIMAYDMRPLDTLHEKERILARCAHEGIALIFEHDKAVEAATLAQTDRGIVLKETFEVR